MGLTIGLNSQLTKVTSLITKKKKKKKKKKKTKVTSKRKMNYSVLGNVSYTYRTYTYIHMHFFMISNLEIVTFGKKVVCVGGWVCNLSLPNVV